MIMVETYKCEELRKKLKSIINWDEVRTGTKIFHNTDNNIYNDNVFLGYDKENNSIKYMVIEYLKPEKEEYTMSSTGWYFYDEIIADEVEEHYTPKLYNIWDIRNEEDYLFMVAFDKKHLKQEYIKDNHLEEMTDKEFWNKYGCEELEEVNGFEVVLK
ncbi:hypothetical protein RSJ8_4072 (plasmid) [Clostridium botulinum]|nr:hypothetical protein NPD1_4115 [Clostridium botulinum]APQ71278.1 hypothetical protein RSJ8_4072 [Clostridium botulinum]